MMFPAKRRHPRRRNLLAVLYAYHPTPGISSYQAMSAGDPLRRIIYACEWWTAFSHGEHHIRLVDHYVERGPDAGEARTLLERLFATLASDATIDLVLVPSRQMLPSGAIGPVRQRLDRLGVEIVCLDEEDITPDEARNLAA